MDLTLQQLRMLREVAEKGTIAAAADSLGYTASAVSQQLGGIEKATGVAVLERVGRNVRLTDAGRELVGHAAELLSAMEAAQAAMERVGGEARGVLAFTVYESVAATLLTPLLSRLAERHPDLELRARQSDPEVAIDALSAGDIDLAFTIDYPHSPVALRADIVRHHVMVDRFHAVVAIDDPLTGPAISLDALADRPFISSPAAMSCGRCVVSACHAAGFDPDIRHELDDYTTAMHLVAAGQGVTLVPDLALGSLPPGVRVLDITPAMSRTIELAYRAASAERPAVIAVLDTLDEIVADLDLTAAA